MLPFLSNVSTVSSKFGVGACGADTAAAAAAADAAGAAGAEAAGAAGAAGSGSAGRECRVCALAASLAKTACLVCGCAAVACQILSSRESALHYTHMHARTLRHNKRHVTFEMFCQFLAALVSLSPPAGVSARSRPSTMLCATAIAFAYSARLTGAAPRIRP